MDTAKVMLQLLAVADEAAATLGPYARSVAQRVTRAVCDLDPKEQAIVLAAELRRVLRVRDDDENV